MTYHFKPSVRVLQSANLYTGYSEMTSEIKRVIAEKKPAVITIDVYPTTDETRLKTQLITPLSADVVINSQQIFKSADQIEQQINPLLTNDPVFGRRFPWQLTDFINQEQQALLKQTIQTAQQKNQSVVVFGVGASLVTLGDLRLYVDQTRNDIIKKYQLGHCNNWQSTQQTSLSALIKRGYFFEWPMFDQHKQRYLPQCDYIISAPLNHNPVMLTVTDYLAGLTATTQTPFSLVPFFDPGVWGGHWMQETFNFRKEEPNLAWCFNGVPEENELCLDYQGQTFTTPGNNLLLFNGKNLLGDRVFGQFGSEFPIRFNFLDTFGGQNLSLQVHPQLDYIKNTFGMPYTQDESYYIMDAKADAKVYLGLKEGIDKTQLTIALVAAQKPGGQFDDQTLINQMTVKKHDHYLIPAGTIHSSGANCMVLEISATPNRFTFKLWDWDRLDLNGKPRPIHLQHGLANIDFTRTTNWVKTNLVNQFERLDTSDEAILEEKTGLHELELIETRRHRFTQPVIHDNTQGVNVIALVDGQKVKIESIDQQFPAFEMTYAQVVIIPATIQKYRIVPIELGDNAAEFVTIKAFIR